LLPLFIICNNNSEIINGTFFHVYELGLYLQDRGVDVYFITVKSDKDFYSIRYTKTLKKITLKNYTEHIIKKYNVLAYNIYNDYQFYQILKKAQNIYHLITDGSLYCFQSCKNKWESRSLEYIKRIQFLYDVDLPNPIENEKIFMKNTKHKCSWGIYDKYYRITHEECNDYFIYARHNDNRMEGILTYSNTNKVEEAIQYCEENNISYVLDTKKCFNPWNKYKGLIYTRNIDYSPRLPFEFGIANKHTICFDTSPGLRTLAEDCSLYKPIIMKTRKKLSLPLELFQ